MENILINFPNYTAAKKHHIQSPSHLQKAIEFFLLLLHSINTFNSTVEMNVSCTLNIDKTLDTYFMCNMKIPVSFCQTINSHNLKFAIIELTTKTKEGKHTHSHTELSAIPLMFIRFVIH